MSIRLTLFFVSIMAIFSCRSTYYYNEIHPKEIDTIEEKVEYTLTQEDEVILKTGYIGNGLDYAIFQIDIQNLSERPITIAYDDVAYQPGSGRVVNSINKYDFIKVLKTEKRNIKKEKKARTIGGILLGGLTLASIAIGGGTNAVNTINAVSYAAESTVYIIDERRAFNATEGTIEEEIKYIEDWVLFEEVIAPNSNLMKDVIFRNWNVDRDFDLLVDVGSESFRIPYDLEVKEAR